MKTFKLLQLEVQGHDVPLIDGVIINQENSRQSWLLEADRKSTRLNSSH